MIEIQIKGQLPNLNSNLEPAMGEIGNLMWDSVQQNFIAGGRPNQWEPLKTGEASYLIKSGKMFRSLTMQSNGEMAMVSIDTKEIPYAAIHNFGGTIVVAARQKVSFEQARMTGGFKKGQFKKGMVTVAGHKTGKYRIDMPQRQFMMFQEGDKVKILKTLSDAIFTTSERTQ